MIKAFKFCAQAIFNLLEKKHPLVYKIWVEYFFIILLQICSVFLYTLYIYRNLWLELDNWTLYSSVDYSAAPESQGAGTIRARLGQLHFTQLLLHVRSENCIWLSLEISIYKKPFRCFNCSSCRARCPKCRY
jgi:hypothetical protein